jgi:hypothetical protein
MCLHFIQSTVKELSILFTEGKRVVAEVEVRASWFGIGKERGEGAAVNIEDRVQWIRTT